MYKLFIFLVLLPILVFSQNIDYDAEWQKMHDSKKAALEQFNEAKFGMFIHWGVYSVPAGIWQDEKIPGLGEWIFYHAQIPRATYKDMCRQFNPVKFDAVAWVKLAKEAGLTEDHVINTSLERIDKYLLKR